MIQLSFIKMNDDNMQHYKKYDPDELKHLQQLELKILKQVISICETHGLKYYAYAGTALGAVRHGGFIPWDDDIDIVMFREDYEKLLKIMETELPDEYYVLNHYKYVDCHFTISRVCLKGTKFEHPEPIPVSFNEGICIDIFPIDNVPESSTKRKLYYYKCDIMRHLFMNSVFKINNNKFNSLFHSIMHHILKRIPGQKFILNRYINCLTKYEKEKTNYCTIHEVRFVYLKFRKIGYFDKKDFEPSKKVKFEDIEIYLQNDYDEQLTLFYGDYMTMPPKEERFNHSGYLIDFGEY